MPVPLGPAQTELGAVVKMQVFPIHFNGVAGLGCGDCRVCSTDPAIRAVKLLHSQPEISLKVPKRRYLSLLGLFDVPGFFVCKMVTLGSLIWFCVSVKTTIKVK